MKKRKQKIIKVKIGRFQYDTVIDKQGTQRFVENSVIVHLFNTGVLDLNKLGQDYLAKKFSKKDYLELHVMLGYSISGFCDLSTFFDVKLNNPLWKHRR